MRESLPGRAGPIMVAVAAPVRRGRPVPRQAADFCTQGSFAEGTLLPISSHQRGRLNLGCRPGETAARQTGAGRPARINTVAGFQKARDQGTAQLLGLKREVMRELAGG